MADRGRRDRGNRSALMTARPLRAVAHLHSNWSYDGSLSLDQIAKILARLGYRAALLSEHDRGFDEHRWARYRRACAAATTGEILMVPGMEYSDAGNDVHVLVWGSESFLGEGRDTASLLVDVHAAGAVAVLAHPGRRSAAARLDAECVEQLHGVEVWNRKYDGIAPGQAGLNVRARHPHLVAFVGLDLHTRRQLFPLSMIFEVGGRAGMAEIMSAMHDRRCSAQAVGVGLAAFSSPMGRVAFAGAERTRLVARDRVRSLRA